MRYQVTVHDRGEIIGKHNFKSIETALQEAEGYAMFSDWSPTSPAHYDPNGEKPFMVTCRNPNGDLHYLASYWGEDMDLHWRWEACDLLS